MKAPSLGGRSGGIPSLPPSLAFSLAFLMFLWIPLGGELFLFEVLTPVIVLARFKVFVKDVWCARIFVCGLVWMVSQVLSDAFNDVPVTESSLQVGMIALTILDILATRLVIGDSLSNGAWCFVGYGSASVVNHFLQPTEYGLVDPWKFGVALGISFATVGVIALRRSRALGISTMLLVAGLNLVFDFRSQAAIVFVTATITMLPISGMRLRGKVLIGASVVIALGCSFLAYTHLASAGSLGPEAQAKYSMQSKGSLGLLSGRAEFIYAGLAIQEHPALGIGSTAADPDNIQARGAALESRYASVFAEQRARDGVVPLHSHILGAWARAGIGALPFWIMLLVVVARGLSAAGTLPWYWRAVAAYSACNVGWDILFSPLGSFGRFQLALQIAVLIATLKTRKPHEDLDRHNFLQPSQLSTSRA